MKIHFSKMCLNSKCVMWGIVAILSLCFIAVSCGIWTANALMSQIFAALLSASIVALITILLMRNEQEKDKNVEIYKAKIAVYTRIINSIWKYYALEEMSEQDINRLHCELFSSLVFYTDDETLNNLKSHLITINGLHGTEDNPMLIKELCEMTNILKKELLNNNSKDGNLNDLWNTFFQNDNTDPSENAGIEVCISNSTDSHKITYWHFNMLNVSKQLNALKNGQFELSLIEYNEEKRTNILRQVKQGDLIFLYRGGNVFCGVFEAVENCIIKFESETYFIDGIKQENNEQNLATIRKHDIYGGFEDGATICANLIVNPLAVMNIPREECGVYRRTISRFAVKYGNKILKRYRAELDKNNELFGRIEGEPIKCEEEKFRKLTDNIVQI